MTLINHQSHPPTATTGPRGGRGTDHDHGRGVDAVAYKYIYIYIYLSCLTVGLPEGPSKERLPGHLPADAQEEPGEGVQRDGASRKALGWTSRGEAKEILGTCFAVGCTVDGQKPISLQQAIDDDVPCQGVGDVCLEEWELPAE